MKRFVLVLLFLSLAGSVLFMGQSVGIRSVTAQTNITAETNLTALHGLIRNFFETLTDNNKGAKKALEEILKNSPVNGNEKLINELAGQLKELNTRFGAYVSFEEIGTKSIGNDLVVIRYLYKCQNYPVVWYFTFYRPLSKTGDSTVSRRWMLIGFRYDSNLDVSLRDTSF